MSVSILLGLLAAPVWAEPETIGLDEEVSGELTPGEELVYRVPNLSPGQRVYLQRTASSATTQLTWQIEDRFGRVIVDSLNAINDLGPVALMGGEYFVTVRGRTPTSSGSFSFILHAVTDTSSSLALDVTDLRSFSGVGATHRFDLLLTQPGPVRLFFGIASPSQLSYRVTDALGNVRTDWGNSAPAGGLPVSLPVGTHQIEVRGRNAFAGEFSFRVRPEIETLVAPLVLNGTVAYASADSSETLTIPFSLSDNSRVYPGFEFTHSVSAGTWQLERADGAQIVDWTANLGPLAEPIALLAGDYRLSIRSQGIIPISGSVTLHEVIDTDSVLEPDETALADILVPGQAHRFQLSDVPAGIYLLYRLDTDNNFGLGWRIEDATGRDVLPRTSNLNAVEEIALIGGDYSLIISGNAGALGFAEFALVTGTVVDQPAVFGGLIDDAIDQPGQIRRYSFSVPADRKLLIERQATSNSFGLNYRLEDSIGRELVSRTSNLPASVGVNLVGGDYVLTVLGEGEETGSYRLALVDEGPSDFVPSGTPLLLDDLADSVISSGTPERWLLTLAEPKRVFFELQQGASNLRWSLFDAAGQALFSNESASSPTLHHRGPFLLAPGQYTVELELSSGGPAAYAFRAVDAPVTAVSVDVDEVIDNQATVPGFRNEYVFDVLVDGNHYFEILQGNNALRWQLVDAAGRPVFPFSSASSPTIHSRGPYPLVAGEYRLVFEANSGSAPDYQFRIHSVVDLNDALVLANDPLPIDGSMTTPGQIHDYAVTIAPGLERLYFQVLSGNSTLRYSLFDEAGFAVVSERRLASANDDLGPLPIMPGDYRLVVASTSPTGGSYSLVLNRPILFDGLPTALDQAETWTDIQPGEQRVYDLELTDPSTPALLYLSAGASNVFATLTHTVSGWQPFANRHLNNAIGSSVGPFVLPAGMWQLTLEAGQTTASPSWELVGVVQPEPVSVQVDEFMPFVGYPTLGSRLSYTFTPDQDGQALIFDMMSNAAGNQWLLLDPVGTPVFGPMAAFNSGSDQGPFPLAMGEYTLTFFNPQFRLPEWIFRIRSANATIEVPEGCAACSALDVVFAFDTSGSMWPVSQAMCDLAEDLIGALSDDGIPVNANYFGLVDTSGGSCLSSSVLAQLGPQVPGSPPGWMDQLDVCPGTTLAQENWAPATAILADRYPWEDDAVRLVIPVADDGPFCGSPIDGQDIDAVYHARVVAAANDVVISPLLPEIAPDPVRALGDLITVGTGGISIIADFDPEDLLPKARALAFAACGTQQAIAVPTFTDLSPLPGSLLPSGVPLVLSGRVVPVNQLRPVLEIEVNGQASSVLDGTGGFFAEIELQPGPNTVTISAVEACGPTVLEIELMGAGIESDPWSGFAEVTDLLQGRFARTTFDPSSQRLLVDVAVDNLGAALKGPIMMAVGVDMHPGVNLLNGDGLTPNGEPYVLIVPEGETLAASGQSVVRELAFSNPGRAAIDFQPRWLAPANQPPYFSSVPLTQATVGRSWSYPVVTGDGNGDAVTLSLLVAPPGMSLSAGQLSWTPSQAGTFDVVLRASDGRGGSARQSFSVQVSEPGFNTPPLFTSTPVTQAPIGASYLYPASAVDPDGDMLSFSLPSGPAGMSVNPASGEVSWSDARPGQHSVILVVDDGQGGQASQSYILFVGEPATTPPGPAFVSTPVTVAAVETRYRYRYRLNPTPGPVPVVSLDQAPSGMSLDANAGVVEWVPDAADLGSHVMELLAVDAAGQEARQRFDLSVLAELPNQPPYFTSSPALAAVIGQPWTYAADAVDPEFEPLQFSLDQAPGDMTVDPDSGLIDWTPAPGTPASVSVSLMVTDPHGAQALQQFELQVRGENSSPVLTSTPPASIGIGQTYTHLFLASDADGDALSFRLISGPIGMTLDPEAGWLSWPTANVSPGSYGFEIAVADDWGGSDVRSFSVEAIEDIEPPEVSIVIERQPACATEPVTVCLQASDNIGIATRSLSIEGQTQELVANCFSWTPSAPGNVAAIATATDTSGLNTSVQRLLQVADCNDEERPVVTLVSPPPESLLVQATPLIASIDDNTPEALTWTVYIRAGEDGEPETLAEGTGPVDDDQIALIDPTRLPEGSYWIGIVGSDGLQTGGIEYRINIGGGYKPGRLLFSTADVVMPIAGIPLVVGRSYDSLEAGQHGEDPGDFGPGWRLSLSASVRDSARESPMPDNPVSIFLAEAFTEESRVHVVKPDGQRVGFTFAPKQRSFPTPFQYTVEFEPDPGVTDTLRAVDGPEIVWSFGTGFADYLIPYNPSIYELETEDRVVYVISESEGLLEVRDALGGVLTVTEAGIESSRGFSLDYLRDDQGRITDIVLPPAEPGAERGRILYHYDAIGNLVSVTDLAGGVSTFEYANPDHPHHVTALFDSLGNPVSQHVYDDEGRAIATCPADGDPVTLEGCSEFGFDLAGGVEVIFDTRGFRSELYYDERGLLTARRDWLDDSEWVEQLWIRDTEGRVIEYVDAEGGQTLSTFDDQGRELTRTYPGGQAITWTYGSCGRDWVTLTDALGNISQREFDDQCRVRYQIDPLGGVTEYQYNTLGMRTALIDPLGQTWSFGFNGLGLITSMTDPLGATETRTYNGLGQEINRVDRSGQQLAMSYDEAGRLLTKSVIGSPQSYSWEYNIRGLVTRESGPDATLDVDYWPTGRIRRIDFSGPDAPEWWVSYDYDGNGNVVDLVDSLGGQVSYEYDGLDRMIAANYGGTGVSPKRVSFDLNKNGLVTRIERFAALDESLPGPTTDVTYVCPSCASQTSRIEHRRPDNALIHDLQFARNANGETVELTDAQGMHQFVYDGRGWLVESTHPLVPDLISGSTSYDAMGNWLSRPGHPGPVTLSYALGEGGHQLRTDGESTYGYNARGALLSRVNNGSGATLNITYDGLERPTTVVHDDGGLSQASYRYTASGARIFAEVDGQRRHFVLDGENVIAALDDDGQVIWRRFHTRSEDRPVAEDTGGVTRWLLTDHLGSIRNQVDSAGQPLAEFAYTPFGRQILGPPPSMDDALRFTGREFDVPGELAYYRARLYDPIKARFVSEDPIEPWHYRYAENNPLRFSDPSGEVAAIEYAMKACDVRGFALFGVAVGDFVQEALQQAVDGFSGKAGNPGKALEKLKDFNNGQLMPCGLPAPI